MQSLIIYALLLFGFFPSSAKAADAYWLDQYNALFYLATFRLDTELNAMKAKGSSTLLLHADSLPSPISHFIAWRPKTTANMRSIAWIQKPNKNNLRQAAQLNGFKGVQIDDHYFNDPPIALHELRTMLGEKELWCSFQPKQFLHTIANSCDQNDIQIYRHTCRGTGDIAWQMGLTGNPRIAVSAYADGSQQGDELIRCIQRDLQTLGTKLFVFKWKNQEVWSRKLWIFLARRQQQAIHLVTNNYFTQNEIHDSRPEPLREQDEKTFHRSDRYRIASYQGVGQAFARDQSGRLANNHSSLLIQLVTTHPLLNSPFC